MQTQKPKSALNWQERLSLLAGGTPEGATPQELKQGALRGGLFSLGLGLLEQGGYQDQPVSFGQALARSATGALSAYGNITAQQKQALAARAKAQIEQAKAAQLKQDEELFKRGNLTSSELTGLAFRNPSMQNVVQQELKNLAARDQTAPSAPITVRTASGGNWVHDGKKWIQEKAAPVPKVGYSRTGADDSKLRERVLLARELGLEGDALSAAVFGPSAVPKDLSKNTSSKGVDSANVAYGKQFTAWAGGKAAAADNALSLLDGAIAELEANPRLSGGVVANTPEFIGKRLFDQAYRLRSDVETTVLPALKDSLDSQFAAAEARAVFDRAYDMSASAETNLKSLKRLAAVTARARDLENARAQHFAETGSITDFKSQVAPLDQYLAQYGLETQTPKAKQQAASKPATPARSSFKMLNITPSQ